ncbi:MAG: adenylosuccinate lyase, partial [Bacteroidales bacterium]|nr:adenylosuccinate lyase [Bacteroidales bacterium]
MDSNYLNAITPIDGRYSEKVKELAPYFSEASLFKYRLLIEVEYFIALCTIPLPQLADFKSEKFDKLRDLYINFQLSSAIRMKEIEKITNHDVKAVEYFLKEKFEELGISNYKEFIHFGLTSQDINNTAVPKLFFDSINEIYIPLLEKLIYRMKGFVQDWKSVPMLARTHGQPASPTTVGKEILVFVDRLEKQLGTLLLVPKAAKFGGATGNFNAHMTTYPEINWVEFADNFVSDMLGLYRSKVTTQIEHYDFLAAIFDNLRRINTILIDFNRDVWTYISLDYFKQKIKAGEIGSSAMPHKVNPIDFENSEGNLGIANAIFDFLANKLPVSRLQRDLTDSTVLRNIGVPVSHTIIALKSTLKGLDKLLLNEEKIIADLENNWSVVAEAIQNILRREGYPN